MFISRTDFRPILILLFLGLIFGCQTATSTPDPEEADEADEADPTEQEAQRSEYSDPDELYTAPIPRNWTVDERDGYTTIAGPDDEVRVHLSAVESDDVEQAIADAWLQLDDTPQLKIAQSTNPPPPEGVEDYVVVHYEVVDDHLAQAVGQLVDGLVYIALIDGDLAAAQRRNAQLQTIVSGFHPTALARVDLTETDVVTLTDEHFEAFRTHIQESMEALDIPGASFGVVQNGEIVWEEAFGVREVGTDAAVTPDTLMMIGSVTKTMTTLLMAQLIDEGLIDWDTPVRDILPEFAVHDPELTETMTIENLVCACTGVPRRDMEFIFNFKSLTAERVIESLEAFEFFTDFGETFQYSNQMVAAAGYVAAAALDSPYGELYEGFEDAITERVFDSIEMPSTTISLDTVLASDDFAMPHARGIEFPYQSTDIEIERFVEPLAPAGAAWSNTRDMTRYLLTMLSVGVAPNTERVVSEENLNKLWEPQVDISSDASYGLGWIQSQHQGINILAHDGATTGFTAQMAIFPESNSGIIILVNGSGANVFTSSARTRLIELLYDQPNRATESIEFGRTTTMEQLEKMRNKLADELDQEALEPYAGRYESETLGELTVTFEDDRLILDADEFNSELRQVDDDEELLLITVDPPLVGLEFKAEVTDDDERVLRFGEGIMSYTFHQIE